MRDYIGDLVVRLKNAQLARLPEVKMHPYFPKRYEKILHLLYRDGFIRGFNEHWDASAQKFVIVVLLNYEGLGQAQIKNIKMISTPGHRVYIAAKAMWQEKSRPDQMILSTTKGFMFDRDARRLNLGGEVILTIV